MGFTPGPLELLIIFVIVLVLFGAKRIPEIARGLGKGIREFKSATSEISRELTVDNSSSSQQRLYQPPAQQPIHANTAPPKAAEQPGGNPTVQESSAQPESNPS